MDVTLHVGAHRCATTTFQAYLRANALALHGMGIGVWGPRRTRGGLFRGVLPLTGMATDPRPADRARGRIALALARSAQAGLHRVVVTDENVLGTPRANLRLATLYPGLADRLARFDAAFGGAVTDVVLTVRSPECYWTSLLTYVLMRGTPMPAPALMERIAASERSWREVIEEVAAAMPRARLTVLTFERFASRPEAQLAAMTGLARPPLRMARERLNASLPLPALRASVTPAVAARLPAGQGPWQPFDARQQARMRERHADDLFWLLQGASGRARLFGETLAETGADWPAPDKTEGRPDDIEARHMAGAG